MERFELFSHCVAPLKPIPRFARPSLVPLDLLRLYFGFGREFLLDQSWTSSRRQRALRSFVGIDFIALACCSFWPFACLWLSWAAEAGGRFRACVEPFRPAPSEKKAIRRSGVDSDANKPSNTALVPKFHAYLSPFPNCNFPLFPLSETRSLRPSFSSRCPYHLLLLSRLSSSSKE